MRYMSLCRALWSRHNGHVAICGYWWVDFFDAEGNLLPDVNSRLYAEKGERSGEC